MATGLRLFIGAILALSLSACQLLPQGDTGTAYLVRHAEKVTDGDGMIVADPKDPPLTKEGRARAVQLADLLKDAGITAIWSSDYTRTRETAAPLARELGLEVQVYDPRDLEALAATLRSTPKQTVLVVGHSNTTPQLSEALGGDSGAPIDETSEYDRLYVVDLKSGETEIRRFGQPYERQEPYEK